MVLAATFALASYALPVRAAETAPAAVIIVDSSGSMAAQEPDGRVRLDAARGAIVEALAT
jgi:Mg-chelatase subunit ChlD